MEFDVKAYLKHFCPEIFELFPESRVDWKKLAKSYKTRYERLLAEHDSKGVARYEASFFEILMYASQGKVEALYVQTFVSGTIKKLKTILNDNELKLIGGNVSGVITNLDMKYYNFVGELATLVIVKNI